MAEPNNDLEMRRRQLQSQQSNVNLRKQQAVCVRRAYKRYGTKKNPFVILDGLNMTVPKGTIYGLLGASGCGKTTLLSCIVGRKRLNSGEIWVLGGSPGARGSGVPGPRIGYMPQDVALYGEFSIRETMKYFGWISEMNIEKVDERLDFLIDLLLLPPRDRLVKTLSGGQQRRVSLCAALIHEPELLILDEPTVGVDPLLRQNIWDHLVKISRGGLTTIIITTHYIDETRQAHLIGLMRGGYFLAEESPEKLMTQFGVDSLEDVFLKLSVMQNRGKRRRSSILQSVTDSITVPAGTVNQAAVLDDEVGEISGEFGDNVSMSSRSRVSIAPEDPELTVMELPPEDNPPISLWDRFRVVKGNHMKALVWKNFLWMWRNFPIMLFLIGLPVSQTVLFCLSIGHDPIDLPLTVVNHELEEIGEVCKFTPGCNSSRLSCNYLAFLQNRSLILTYFDTDEDAKNVVRKGKAWGALIFSSNYSDALRARLNNGRELKEWDVDNSEVDVFQDISNQNIGSWLKRDLFFSFQDFFQDYVDSCGYDKKIATIPVRFNDPIYGPRNPNFTDFAAPGVILTIIFFLAVALTAVAMLLERNEGILERSLVNGVTGVELLFAHVITQFVVMVIQTILVLVCTFGIFDITQKGDISLVVLLTLLTGLCGMCFGFVVSCSCETERTATYLALGSFLPIVMLCGVMWPIEAMHKILRVTAFFLPLTKSVESLRSIMQKGWTIQKDYVYEGFVATLIWILIFLTISILILKFKKG